MWFSDSAELIQSASKTPTKGPEDESDDTDVEELPETDGDRRQTMMTSMDASEADRLRTGSLTDFWGDFILPKRSTGESHGTGSKATGDDGPPPRATLQRTGNTSIVTSATAAPVRTPAASKFTPAPEESQHEKDGLLGRVVAKPHSTLDAALSNSTQKLKVGNEVTTIREDRQTMWSCLVCTL
jgi:hypothetical protein